MVFFYWLLENVYRFSLLLVQNQPFELVKVLLAAADIAEIVTALQLLFNTGNIAANECGQSLVKIVDIVIIVNKVKLDRI